MREKLIRKALRYIRWGFPLPVDLQALLLSTGVNPEELK
jgi:hypothetical protein